MHQKLKFQTPSLATALERAKHFASEKGLSFNDDLARTRRAGGGLSSEAMVTPEVLPKASGIYLIHGATTNQWYVGLAQDIHTRFTNPAYGHLTVTNELCRAHHVLNSGPIEIFIAEILEYAGDDIACAEIDWYFMLTEMGESVVNAQFTLGKKGNDGTPIVSCNLASGEHFLFSTQQEPMGLLGLKQYEIAMCVSGGNRQVKGFTHRRATLAEVDAEQVLGATATFDGIRWAGGMLSRDQCNILLHCVRFDKKRATRGDVWQASCYNGRAAEKGNTLRFKLVGYFADQLEAALARERFVVENGLQQLNTSNAAKLNQKLGTREFADWKNNTERIQLPTVQERRDRAKLSNLRADR